MFSKMAIIYKNKSLVSARLKNWNDRTLLILDNWTRFLRVRAQHGEDQGKIYPPVLTLSYSEITAQHIQTDTPVQISFYVDFYKDSRVTYTIDVRIEIKLYDNSLS